MFFEPAILISAHTTSHSVSSSLTSELMKSFVIQRVQGFINSCIKNPCLSYDTVSCSPRFHGRVCIMMTEMLFLNSRTMH